MNKRKGDIYDYEVLISQLTDRQVQEKAQLQNKVAKELSFIYVDTGAMYRAMAVYLAG